MILRGIILFLMIVIVGASVLDWRENGRRKNVEVKENSPQDNGGTIVECEVDFPAGTKMMVSDSNGKGWKQSGVLPLSIIEADDWLEQYMLKKGFYKHHSVGLENRATHSLSEWRNGYGKRMMWVLWPLNGKTGFSWGDVK